MEKFHRIYVDVTLVRASSRVYGDPQMLAAGRYYLAFKKLTVMHVSVRGWRRRVIRGANKGGGVMMC